MDVTDNPTDPKEVELTEGNKKTPPEKNNQEQLIEDINITFCTHVGWDGVLVMLFSLGIAGLFVYITFLYTKKFEAWHRPGVWVFMLFAVLYMLSILVYIFLGGKKSPSPILKIRRTKEISRSLENSSSFGICSISTASCFYGNCIFLNL